MAGFMWHMMGCNIDRIIRLSQVCHKGTYPYLIIANTY